MNPYRIPEPFVVSFSGGRTSAYMLRKILDAYDGRMPNAGHVVFENTGKEREETLRFVERCSLEWGVEIVWLEYRYEPGRPYFVEVNFATASRKGEPFEAVIEARSGGYLPNPIGRYCTVEMKMLTLNRYVRHHLGWEKYKNVVGLRSDEGKRVAKAKNNAFLDVQMELFGDGKKSKRKVKSGRPTGESVAFPLFDAGVTLGDVMDFWAKQPFDLGLNQDSGNCDLCYLKGMGKLIAIMREKPELADWWIEQERRIGANGANAKFRNDRPGYAELLAIAQDKQTGPGWLWADEQNGSCGELDECRCTD